MEFLTQYLGAAVGNGFIRDFVVSSDATTLEGFVTDEGYLPYEDFLATESDREACVFEAARSPNSPIGTLLLEESRVIGRISDARLKNNYLTAYMVQRPILTRNATFTLAKGFTLRTRKQPVKRKAAVTASKIPDNTTDAHMNISPITPIPPFGIPVRVIADYGFLLGRIVTDDIVAGGETIVTKGETILTGTVIAAAEKYKLLDLTVKSRV